MYFMQERENSTWKERVRTELEMEIRKQNEAQQREFEQKVMEAMQQSLLLQQNQLKERETRTIALERDMFER